MAFDANISIIKRLRGKYDVYYIFLVNEGMNSIGYLSNLDDINCADGIDLMTKFHDFLDLSKTYLIRHPVGANLKKLVIEYKVYKLISKIHSNVILADATLIGTWLSRIAFRKKTIAIVHDPFPHSGENPRLRKLIEKIFIKTSKKIVLFNENQKNKFSEVNHIDKKNIYCSFLSQYEFLNFADKGLKMLPSEPDKLKVLFFGRISPYKGIGYLYDATKQYLEAHNDLHVVIAGKGNLCIDTSEIGSEYLTIYNRFIKTEELYSLIDWCDIVVCPYTDATQSGVIMSSYALRKPVIATNVGGLPEMLQNGKLGLLVEPKNSKALCDAFEYVRNHKDCLDAYSERIERAYFNNGDRSWEKAVNIISEAIESI